MTVTVSRLPEHRGGDRVRRPVHTLDRGAVRRPLVAVRRGRGRPAAGRRLDGRAHRDRAADRRRLGDPQRRQRDGEVERDRFALDAERVDAQRGRAGRHRGQVQLDRHRRRFAATVLTVAVPAGVSSTASRRCSPVPVTVTERLPPPATAAGATEVTVNVSAPHRLEVFLQVRPLDPVRVGRHPVAVGQQVDGRFDALPAAPAVPAARAGDRAEVACPRWRSPRTGRRRRRNRRRGPPGW